MPTRYIQVHRTPPPGESIALVDLDERPAIAAGDVPTAEWEVELPDGNIRRMTGQQVLGAVGGTPGTGGSGRPAEIEIEDIADGIRIRGKSGDDANFGPWHIVRDGRDGTDGTDGIAGMPAAIEIEDIVGGIRIRGKSGDSTEFGEWHEVRDGRDGTGSAETIYPVSGLLNPVADYLGAVSASRLNFVLGRLNPITKFYPVLPLSRLGENDFITKLGDPFSYKLRAS